VSGFIEKNNTIRNNLENFMELSVTYLMSRDHHLSKNTALRKNDVLNSKSLVIVGLHYDI